MSTSDFQPSVRTVLASFLFVDIVGFSKVPAARQHALKAGLIAVLHRHLGILHIGDFRLRDTGDGALLSFLSNPEHALYMALAVADDLARVATEGQLALTDLRTGINLGAVKESLDVESRPNYVGDGINAAQRIMDFAQPGQITASRSFMDAVSQLDAAYEALFSHLGAKADKHGRKHELFAITPSEPVLRRLRSDIIVARPPQVEVDFDLDRLAPPVVPLPATAVQATGPASEFASTQLPSASASATAAAPRARSVLWLGLVAVVLSAVLGVLIARLLDHAEPAAPASAASVPAPPAVPASAAPASVVSPSAAPSQPPAASPAASVEPASTPAPSVNEPAPASAPRLAASAPVKPAPRKPAEAPVKPPAAVSAPTPAPAPAPAAEAPAVSEQARQRCSRIMQKVGIGEPLTAEEKNNLANSCR